MIVKVSSVIVLAMLRYLAQGTDAYHEIADSVASAANADPLFEREDGAERSATQLVAIAWKESGFASNAVGDQGRSFGLYAIMASVWKVDANTLLSPRSSSPIALALVKRSHRQCAHRPWGERLTWYAASATCGEKSPNIAIGQSLERMHLADQLFKKFFPDHAHLAPPSPIKPPSAISQEKSKENPS